MIKYLVLFSILFLQAYPIKVLSNNGGWLTFPTPKFIGNKMEIDGKLISILGIPGTKPSELQECHQINTTKYNLTDSIAVLAPFGGCSFEKHIEVAQNAGAKAVIMLGDQDWRICGLKDARSSSFKHKIPAVCLKGKFFTKIVQMITENASKNPPLLTYIQFTEEPNELYTLNKAGMNIWYVFFFVSYIFTFFLSLWRLVVFIKEDKKFVLNFTNIQLLFNLYISIVNAITNFDFLGYRQYYGNIYQFSIVSTIYFGSSIAVAFLVFSANINRVLVKMGEKKKLLQRLHSAISIIFLVLYITVGQCYVGFGLTYNLTEKLGLFFIFNIVTFCLNFFNF
eukprot:TRINITY_DN1120_c0_g1_i1.p1 TRINITY_DN1120_c0_g1~~TRINITY_DN1120_c0_g1_i1.p1  ORF type:complete len:338 (-),score=33.21 TRINITY_DN1120_c0_g1_i1:388-1401(-)